MVRFLLFCFFVFVSLHIKKYVGDVFLIDEGKLNYGLYEDGDWWEIKVVIKWQ